MKLSCRLASDHFDCSRLIKRNGTEHESRRLKAARAGDWEMQIIKQ